MGREYCQTTWDDELEEDCRALIRLALREDLRADGDLTSRAVIEEAATGRVHMVAREDGIACGLGIAPLVIAALNGTAMWRARVNDGDPISPGTVMADMQGSVRELLVAERLVLNLVSKLSGVATRTMYFVRAVANTGAKVYDTRKTTPGYRRLEKYAVRCGGGTNHRLGLYDGVLIKDNHLANMACHRAEDVSTSAAAVELARAWVEQSGMTTNPMIEVEVDTLEQFEHALAAHPDVILLDNMSCEQLRRAVAMRNEAASATELEASGGVNLTTIHDIAECGVDRISVGGLTHQAVSLDIGFDWATDE